MEIFLSILLSFTFASNIQMTSTQATQSFLASIKESLENQTFVKLSLGNYKGADESLKNVYIKRILVKKEEKLSFNYRYKTRDIVKNYAIDESFLGIENLFNDGFRVATLFTTGFDLIVEIQNEANARIRKVAATNTNAPSLEHNVAKQRLITAEHKSYLHSLGITDAAGNVLKHSQDKYRQIDHYIQILSSLLKEIPAEKLLKVADMGSGKGYLTFALYDYLSTNLGIKPQVTGVEIRKELVDLCNDISANSKFENLNFEESSIGEYDCTGVNILIALHACDTATDDAIFKGINTNADLIVVAPCCHKQIRREIEKHHAHNDVDFLTKYGIFLERQAEMVTDGIRAMILEYYGYKTKVLEFVSDAHTPKNVMIVGVKNPKSKLKSKEILRKITEAKKYFGIEKHHLEELVMGN